MKKRLPVIVCLDCTFRGRGSLDCSVEVARGGSASGVVVSVQGERYKLFCPLCGGPNTFIAKRRPEQGRTGGSFQTRLAKRSPIIPPAPQRARSAAGSDPSDRSNLSEAST